MAKSELAPNINFVRLTNWHLARRACTAPTNEIATQIARLGNRGWVEQQLDPMSIDDSFVEDLLRRDLVWAAVLVPELERMHLERNPNAVLLSGVPMSAAHYAHRTKTILRHLYSERHLLTMMADFWADHFSLNDKGHRGTPLADQMLHDPTYAFGTFESILYRTMTCGKFLDGLDNFTNGKKDANGVNQINENLGRELLELYTVGTVYTEDDVKAASVLASGHLQEGKFGAYAFFHPNHKITAEPQVVLGRSYPNHTYQVAADSWKQLSVDLARDPRTIRRICTKLAIKFICDEPTEAMVNRIVLSWNSSGGDIKVVLRNLFASNDFMNSTGRKMITPSQYFATVCRAAEMTWTPRYPDNWLRNPMTGYRARLAEAGDEPRAWQGPDGRPQVGSAYMGPSQMLQCWNWAYFATWGLNIYSRTNTYGDEELKRSKTWTELLGIRTNASAQVFADGICRHLTGFVPDQPTRDAVIAALGAKVNGRFTDKAIDEAVRVTLQSPFAFVR